MAYSDADVAYHSADVICHSADVACSSADVAHCHQAVAEAVKCGLTFDGGVYSHADVACLVDGGARYWSQAVRCAWGRGRVAEGGDSLLEHEEALVAGGSHAVRVSGTGPSCDIDITVSVCH